MGRIPWACMTQIHLEPTGHAGVHYCPWNGQYSRADWARWGTLLSMERSVSVFTAIYQLQPNV